MGRALTMSEVSPDSLTALRRSKRKKFHLDVAAVFSGSSNPDKRRNNLDAKYAGKEANHAVSGRNPFRLRDSLSNSRDMPDLDIEQDAEKIENLGCAELEHTHTQSSSSTSSRRSTPTTRSCNGATEPNGLVKEHETIVENEVISLNKVKELTPDIKEEEVVESKQKNGTTLYFCAKCGTGLKSKSGLIVHSKYCEKGISKRSRKRRMAFDKQHNVTTSTLLKPTVTVKSINPTFSEDASMPILLPEGPISGANAPTPSKKPKKGNKSSLTETVKQERIDFSSLKLLNLPPLPAILIKPTGIQQKEFYCCECPYKSIDDTLYRIHRSMHIGDRPQKCSGCSFSCFSPESLYAHLDLHVSNSSLNPSRKSRVIKKKELETIPSDREDVIKCSQCSFKTLCMERFHQHRLDHVQTQQQRLVSIMKRTHTNINEEPTSSLVGPNPKILHCKLCEFWTEGPDNLEHHVEYHNSGQLYTCRLCDYASDERTVKNFHEKHHHTSRSLSDHIKNLAIAIKIKKERPNETTAIKRAATKRNRYVGKSLAVQSLLKALE
ncbi:unnamed protein product [Bursaphelenchus okinawaensis]|uniref:C2H2-type domain-containing protein n=1 Tax=Bursaphelenchus okinawaensis TaxID=465554 RepID=A0A811JTC9_9BILA|nr:unnamed protein product [Bursaphelenchus okinawaensis]CAG9082379.1 unnamed protein product [Bursaphelenchus okinawaensis]